MVRETRGADTSIAEKSVHRVRNQIQPRILLTNSLETLRYSQTG